FLILYSSHQPRILNSPRLSGGFYPYLLSSHYQDHFLYVLSNPWLIPALLCFAYHEDSGNDQILLPHQRTRCHLKSHLLLSSTPSDLSNSFYPFHRISRHGIHLPFHRLYIRYTSSSYILHPYTTPCWNIVQCTC